MNIIKDKHKLIIDKIASKYVIQIFDSAKEGKTASEIANEILQVLIKKQEKRLKTG